MRPEDFVKQQARSVQGRRILPVRRITGGRLLRVRREQGNAAFLAEWSRIMGRDPETGELLG
jgi:hypothetical protein